MGCYVRGCVQVAEVAVNPFAEACWYFPTSREQYRLGGTLTVVDIDHTDPKLQGARQAAWARLSGAARSQFSWPAPRALRYEDALAFSKPAPDPQVQGIHVSSDCRLHMGLLTLALHYSQTGSSIGGILSTSASSAISGLCASV